MMEEHAKTVECFENECDEFVYEVLMCKDNEWQRNSTMLISKVFNYILMACCSRIDIITTYTNNAANSSAIYGVMPVGTNVFCPNG